MSKLKRRGEAKATGSDQKRIGLAAATLVVVLAVAALLVWGLPGGSAQQQGQAAGPPYDFEVSIYTGAEQAGGDTVQFSSLFDRGQPVVLNFWAGNCPPCRAEMPGFQSVFEAQGDRFTLVGVDVGPFTGLGTRDSGRDLVAQLGITYLTGTTFDSNVPRQYRIQGMPTTVFLTPTGKIFRRRTGYLPEDQLRRTLQDLLARFEESSGGA